MTAPDDSQNTRPISVAELLAKNGTIGSPPVGGRRRRRRGNSDAATAADRPGEIPIIRTGEIPVAREEAPAPAGEETASEPAPETAEPTPRAEQAAAPPAANGSAPAAEPEPEEPQRPFDAPPERADAPLPRRESGPARSYDPRPRRRPAAPPVEVAAPESESGAEQMTFDPLDDSATLLDLSGAQQEADGAAELQSYLRSSGGTLFGGETVADDLARRGVVQQEDQEKSPATVADTEPAPAKERSRAGTLAALGRAGLAALQSILAVAFGAGLFIAFDQLWRWNNIVALVLSVLVILGLVVAVRVVRKTEDIASTLIAVAVGALVTLGPLALLQST